MPRSRKEIDTDLSTLSNAQHRDLILTLVTSFRILSELLIDIREEVRSIREEMQRK